MFNPDTKKTIRHLQELLGQQTCLNCGFLGRDDKATLFLTPQGTGYLLDIVTQDVDKPHEAYAAGYQQGYQQGKNG